MAELVIVRVSLQIAWGLLSNKLVKKLKQGCRSDEALRNLLLDKFQKIHEELNSLRRKELVAAISFMENGYELFLTDTIEAKKEFSKARDAAQMAFGVVSEVTDKLLATKILLASAMHEFDDKIETAVSLCLKYISRLNSLPEIANICEVYLGLGSRFRSMTGSANRQEVLKVLSEVNRNVWKFVKQSDAEFHEEKWPYVCCKDRRLNPVHDLIPVRECQEISKVDCGLPVAMVIAKDKLFVACACSQLETADNITKNNIIVYNLEPNSESSGVQVLSGHTAVVLTLAIAQGKVFSGSYDRSILVWDACSLDFVQNLGRHDGAVRSLVASKTQLFSAGTDKIIKAWDIESFGLIALLCGHNFPISLLAFQHHLFSYAPGEAIRIWNVNTWNTIGVIPDPGNVSSMYCSVGSDLFVHCGMDVMVWNLGKMKKDRLLKDVGRVCVKAPGMKIIGIMDENICHYDASSSKCLYNEPLKFNECVEISVVHYCHDLGLLFLGGKLKKSKEGILLCL